MIRSVIEGASSTESKIPAPTDIDFGHELIRGFLFDNVLHSESDVDIHFGLYIPESYEGSEPYALYVTLPGYEGLYFQGVGVNIRAEDYGIEAQKYNEKMIIAAPQLNDWRETSARQTVALTRYLISHSIDAQMKALIDRTLARWTEVKNKEFYYIVTCADRDKAAQETTLACFRGYADCVEGAEEKGVIYGTGVYQPGEIKNSPAFIQAYEVGKTIR